MANLYPIAYFVRVISLLFIQDYHVDFTAVDLVDRQTDSLALVDFYDSTNGPNWLVSWDLTQPMEAWNGVTLNSTGRVMGLNLPSNFLEGPISESIGALTALETIDCFGNQLNGVIPESIGDLTNLVSLDLQQNQLAGNIPGNLGNLKKLQILDLESNQLTGSIPVELSGLDQLTNFDLENNNLDGVIPKELGVLPNLQVMNFGNNQFSGEIPAQLAEMAQINIMLLDSNQLTGCFPEEFQDLCGRLTLSDFSGNTELSPNEGDFNQFCQVGPSSCAVLCDHPDYQALSELYSLLGGENWINKSGWEDGVNGLNCDVCSWYGIECADNRVVVIDIDNNNLRGAIYDLEFPNLLFLSLLNNNIFGELPDFSGLPNLEHLDLTLNDISGEVPDFSGLPKLTKLKLSLNDFTGAIPNFSNLPLLTFLSMGQNELEGPLPAFEGSPLLESLFLADNGLSGPIPEAWGNLEVLRQIILSRNRLSGKLPSALGNLTEITHLYLDDNQLTGCFPESYKTFCPLPFSDDSSLSGQSFADNLELSWKGDFSRFCSDEEQVGAFCDDGNSLTIDDTINASCACAPEVIGSCRFQDSLELVRFYQLTNGPNWLNTWDLTEPMDNWYGVSLNIFGCVFCLDLDGNPNCDSIDVDGNNVRGPIPDLNLPELEKLYLSNNPLNESPIPDFSSLPNLKELYLNNNVIEGELPNFTQLPNLEILNVSDNALGGEIPNFSTNLPKLAILRLQGNKYTFSGILPHFDAIRLLLLENKFGEFEDYVYAPQDSVFVDTLIVVSAGTNLSVELGVDEGLNTSTYNWDKDYVYWDTEIGDNNLDFQNIQLSDQADYCAAIRNPKAPDLTLKTRVIRIEVIDNVFSLNFSKEDISCFGAADGAIFLEVIGGSGNFSYDWNEGFSDQKDLIDLSKGTYQVKITDQTTGATVTQAINIEEPDPMQVGFATDDASCFDAADGELIVLTMGGTEPYTYKWEKDLPQDLEQINLVPGDYTVTVTDKNGCFQIETVTIDGPPQIEINVEVIPETCPGELDGTITLIVEGGSGTNYTYNWENGVNTPNRAGLGFEVYAVTVSDQNGCMTSEVIEVGLLNVECSPCTSVVLSAPNVEESQFYCVGEELPLLSAEVPQGQTVNWYDASVGGNLLASSSLAFRPNEPGVYYAEASLAGDETCTSGQRSRIELRRQERPIIGLNRQPDCFENGFVVSLTVTNATDFISNADSVIQNQDVYNLFYNSIDNRVEVRAFNTLCEASFILDSPNCVCTSADLMAPEVVLQQVNYCPEERDAIPELIARVSENIEVRWYDQPVAGQLLANNTNRFAPPGQGIFYAEAFDPVLGCRSNNRTPFLVFENAAPFIREYSRFCTSNGSTYSVVLEIEGADAILSSAGDLIRGLNNLDTIQNIPIDVPITVIATNQTTLCQSQLQASPPACTCANIQPPIATIRRYEYCSGQVPPEIFVNVQVGLTANWYDAPDQGNLLQADALSFRPDGPGTYYVETYSFVEQCASLRRIGIEVRALTSSATVQAQTTCRVSELGADTLFLANSVGCDSLIITNTYLEDLVTRRNRELVCSEEVVGFDTLIVLGEDGCSAFQINEKVLLSSDIDIEALDDRYPVQPGGSQSFIDLLENDRFPEDYLFELINPPTEGTFDFENLNGSLSGKLNYTAPEVLQNINFEYRLCSGLCPELLCDTAAVQFVVDCDTQAELTFFKVITPNDDGQNDYFDPLEAFLEAGCPLDPAKVNLTIVNRFGEVVFRTENQYVRWEGKSLSGNDLPVGTYFYVFELKESAASYQGYVDLIR